MLEQTAEIVARQGLAPMAQRLRDTLSSKPLQKPSDHRGPEETDMFVLDLQMTESRMICAALEAARCAGQTTRATEKRGLGGFCEAWREYVDWVESR